MTSISAFDLDHTLVRGNSSAAFCHYLCREDILPFTALIQSGLYYLRYHLMGMSLSELHHSIFQKVLKGRSLEDLEGHVERFVEEYARKSLYMPAVSLLKRAQHLGHYTMILSTSPSFLVKSFAKFLGVNEFCATEYTLDQEQCLTEISQVLEGRDKARYLRKIMQKLGSIREAVTVYSDSWRDLEFLKAAGTPIVVNPDKRLRAFSSRKRWKII